MFSSEDPQFSFLQAPPKAGCTGSAASSEEEEEEEDSDVEEEEEDRKPQTAPPSAPSHPLLIGSCSGFIETTVKIKQNDMLPGPKVGVPRHIQPTSVTSRWAARRDIAMSHTICI